MAPAFSNLPLPWWAGCPDLCPPWSARVETYAGKGWVQGLIPGHPSPCSGPSGSQPTCPCVRGNCRGIGDQVIVGSACAAVLDTSPPPVSTFLKMYSVIEWSHGLWRALKLLLQGSFPSIITHPKSPVDFSYPFTDEDTEEGSDMQLMAQGAWILSAALIAVPFELICDLGTMNQFILL